MTWWQIALLVWAGVGALLFAVIHWSLRSEPTSHGHIVGGQMAMLLLLFWPVILPLLIVNGVQQAIADREHRKWVDDFERRHGRGG